jgi:hypothetical protein
MAGGSVIEGIQTAVSGAIDYFLNFGKEIVVLEGVLLDVIVPGVGILISASAVRDFMRIGNPKYQNKVSSSSVAIRFVIGPATVQLVILMNAMAESIFGQEVASKATMSALSYSGAPQGGDPTAALMIVIVSFLIFVGWVTALRSMLAFSRMGDPQENGYQLFRSGAARLVAATFLCMFQFVLDDVIQSFTGAAGVFSSSLNL